jgi:hypothetical protein
MSGGASSTKLKIAWHEKGRGIAGSNTRLLLLGANKRALVVAEK